MKLKSIDDVTASIQQFQQCSFFIGAGLSLPAGIPTTGGIIVDSARKIYEETLGDCLLDPSELMSWLSKQKFFDPNRAYSSVLNTAFASEVARVGYFENLMIGVRPTKAHFSIAEIIDKGYADVVVTTNFDRLMEYAILNRCGHFPIIVLSKSSLSDECARSWRPKVLKLHGDYLYGDIRNLDQELYLVKTNMSQKLHLVLRNGPVLVAGYSAGDASVMDAMETYVNNPSLEQHAIFWLTIKGTPPNARVLQLLEKLENHGAGVVEIEDGDRFFVELANRLPIVKLGTQDTFRLTGQTHLVALDSAATDRLIEQKIGRSLFAELHPLLHRRPELAPYTQAAGSLDYLLSRFAEGFELPFNLGEMANRYVDLIAGAFLEDRNSEVKRALRTRKDLDKLGLLAVSMESSDLYRKILMPFLDALEKLEDQMPEQILLGFRQKSIPMASLVMSVGLMPDATFLVAELLSSVEKNFYIYLHSRSYPEPFHLAARLTGAANKVSQSLVDRLVDLLSTEFDAEQWFPEEAVNSLSALGPRAVSHMVEYIVDTGLIVFSREDSAEVLGKIGTRQVVEALKKNADKIPANDTLIVDALGRTENPQAIPVLAGIARRLSENRNDLLQAALVKVGYVGEPIVAQGKADENLPYPDRADLDEVIEKYCPGTPDRRYSQQITEYIVLNHQGFDDFHGKHGTPEDIALLLTTAEKLQKTGLFPESEALLIECLLRYPWVYHIYHYVGLHYYQMARFPIARRYFRLGLHLKPTFSGYYTDFGLTMEELGNSQAARHLFVKAIMLDPKNHVPWYNLAAVDLGLANTKSEKKNEYLDGKLFRIVQDWDFEETQDYSPFRAAICLRQVLWLRPEHPLARKQLEVLCEIHGIYFDADVPPTDEELIHALDYGKIIPSRPIWSDDMPEDAFRLAKEANRLERLGKFEEGIETMKQAIRICPDQVRLRINVANMATRLGQLQETVEIISEGLAIEPFDHDLLVSYSIFLNQSGDFVELVIAAENAIRSFPEFASAWMALCEAYRASGTEKKKAAIDAYHHAMELCEPWSWVALNADEIKRDLGISDDTV